jgi:hypothetical protein
MLGIEPPPNLLLEHLFDLSDLFLNFAGVLFSVAFGLLDPQNLIERICSCIRSELFPTASAVCQKKIDNAVGQCAGPQWTRCHRGPTAFPIPTAR